MVCGRSTILYKYLHRAQCCFVTPCEGILKLRKLGGIKWVRIMGKVKRRYLVKGDVSVRPGWGGSAGRRGGDLTVGALLTRLLRYRRQESVTSARSHLSRHTGRDERQQGKEKERDLWFESSFPESVTEAEDAAERKWAEKVPQGTFIYSTEDVTKLFRDWLFLKKKRPYTPAKSHTPQNLNSWTILCTRKTPWMNLWWILHCDILANFHEQK